MIKPKNHKIFCLAAVKRLQGEVERLKKLAMQFDEPFLSHASRRLIVRDSAIRCRLARAGWELQAVQCSLEQMK